MASFTQRRSDVRVAVHFLNKQTGEERVIVLTAADDYRLFVERMERNGWVIMRDENGYKRGYALSRTSRKLDHGFRTHAAYIRA